MELSSDLLDVETALDEAYQELGSKHITLVKSIIKNGSSIYDPPTSTTSTIDMHGMITYNSLEDISQQKSAKVDAVIAISSKCLRDNNLLDTNEQVLITPNIDTLVVDIVRKFNILRITPDMQFGDINLSYNFECVEVK